MTPEKPPEAEKSILRRIVSRVIGDLLLPFLGYASAVILAYPMLFFHRNEVFTTFQHEIQPRDLYGTLWFYWWLEKAVSGGKPLLWSDAVCAPGGQALGTNFPNRIDAYIAFPFFHLFDFPASFNLFLITLLILGGVATFWALRALTRSRLLAFAAGLLFCLNAYSLMELREGRPVTGMLFLIPLLLATLLRSLSASSWRAILGWTSLSGILATLLVQAYVPFAIWFVPLGVLLVLARSIWPLAGVSRLRPVTVGVVVAILGLTLSLPYVHEILVMREQSQYSIRMVRASIAPLPLWNPQLYADLRLKAESLRKRQQERDQTPYLSWQSSDVQKIQRQSMSIDWPWGYQPGQAQPRVWLPPLLLATVLLLLPFGGRRALGWLAVCVTFYSLSLGPYAAFQSHGRIDPVMWGGMMWKTPAHWMLEHVPLAADFLRPLRVFPYVLLGVLCLVVAASDHVAPKLRAMTEKRNVRFSTYVPTIWTCVISLILLMSLLQVHSRAGLVLPMTWWRTHPINERLAKMDGDFTIAELPPGIGHGFALSQLVHGKKRTESHHDLFQQMRRHDYPPANCYRLPFTRALWALHYQRSSTDELESQGFSREAIADARAAGIKYAVMYGEGYRLVEREGLLRSAKEIREELEVLLGPPVHEDPEIVVFEIPEGGDPSKNTPLDLGPYRDPREDARPPIIEPPPGAGRRDRAAGLPAVDR